MPLGLVAVFPSRNLEPIRQLQAGRESTVIDVVPLATQLSSLMMMMMTRQDPYIPKLVNRCKSLITTTPRARSLATILVQRDIERRRSILRPSYSKESLLLLSPPPSSLLRVEL